MTTNPIEKLEPCPFCGQQPRRAAGRRAICEGLLPGGKAIHPTISMLETDWNTRAETPQSGEREATLSENDLYYLRSIRRQLDELHTWSVEHAFGPTISTQVLADNYDWLDCFISRHERSGHLSTRPLEGDKHESI